MSDQIALGHVDPYAGIVITGRTWQYEELITGMKPGQMPRPGAENRPVNRRPKRRGVLWRKRGWYSLVHRQPIYRIEVLANSFTTGG